MSVVANERIDFHQLAKPANLKNSAVLRMLEEEENRKRNGQPSAKQVIWPPPPDSDEYSTVEEAPVYAQGGAQYHNQQASPVQHQRNKPVSLSFQQQPQQQQQPVSPQPFAGSPQPKGWAPVHSPVSVQPQPQYQPQPTQAFRPPVAAPEPPPSTITLRATPPISQAPAPVYTSQPATASLNGGSNMRGDQKWPPASVRAQCEAENEQRRQLAKGPAFRPRKVKKDYSSFFAQHALNSTYPGYRAPPGTQHYEEPSGVTNF